MSRETGRRLARRARLLAAPDRPTAGPPDRRPAQPRAGRAANGG
ncbi:hypothetical protein [Streptomyces sp. NBC_00691]|nr:hypothetical protein [Streptomyces sp. NBC_00691]